MVLIHVITTFIYEEFLITSVMMLITMNSSFTKTEIKRTGFYFLSILREKKSNASVLDISDQLMQMKVVASVS